MPAIGALAGILVAAGLGLLLFQWGAKINIRLFFQVMGILLLLIVSGLVISALKQFDVALRTFSHLAPRFATLCFSSDLSNASCILGPLVWNGKEILPDQQFPGMFSKLYWATEKSFTWRRC
jgi:high-affinity iron transporter